MFSFINETLAAQQVMVTIIIFAVYLLLRGPALWNLDFEAITSKKGFVIDFVLSFIGGAYWMYCFFIDWKTTAVLMIVLTIICSVFSFVILRERLVHLLSAEK